MKDYIRWSLRQLYLIYFWPTQFEREAESIRFVARFRYILRMLPSMVALIGTAYLFAGYICGAFGIPFEWSDPWDGMITGLLFGMLTGVVSDRKYSVVFSVALAVVLGTSDGLGSGPKVNVGFGVEFVKLIGVTAGLAYGVICGVMIGIALGVLFNVTRGLIWGMILGLLLGISFSVRSNIPTGVAFFTAFSGALWLTCFRLVTYPFDAALSTMAYIVGRWRPHSIAQAWRWSPVAWNAMIWLPLPFASKLLVMVVQQDRAEGLRQIAFIAAERKLQRRTALKALVQVAVNDLRAKSINEMADATDKLDWTTDAPAVLVDEIKTALPRFDRAAQHIVQYLTLHNAYRKSEALKHALAEIEALQRSLIASRGRAVPQLLRTANEWRGLIESEIKTIEARAETAREMPNPFVFSDPVKDTEHNVFTGRRDIARQIEASILGANQAPTLLLHGPRRMGKTSILNQLPRLLGPDFAPAIIDCQNPAVTGSAATLLRYVSRGISAGLQRRRVTVKPLDASSVNIEPFTAFDEWLDRAEREMPQSMRALLCLDEYERLQAAMDAGWGASFLDALRHVLQHRQRIVLIFTGARTFQELGPAWTDRFISARRVRVSFLTREEVLPLLTKPIPEFKMTYADGALDALISATCGQPFLTQAVAFELVQHLNEQQRTEATCEDVEAAMARALTSGGEYFANVWSDAGEQGQAILRAIVREETPPDYFDARKWLVEHDVLNEAGEFAVPLVKRWVRETKIA